jgi:hypothetical protein
MRLVMIADQAGVRLGYELRPANEREYEPTFRLAGAHPEIVLFADKGLWGREFKHTLELIGVELVTPARHRLGGAAAGGGREGGDPPRHGHRAVLW